MKLGFFHNWTFPWNQCEHCIIGPGVLNEGTRLTFTLGLFFLEVGIWTSGGNWKTIQPLGEIIDTQTPEEKKEDGDGNDITAQMVNQFTILSNTLSNLVSAEKEARQRAEKEFEHWRDPERKGEYFFIPDEPGAVIPGELPAEKSPGADETGSNAKSAVPAPCLTEEELWKRWARLTESHPHGYIHFIDFIINEYNTVVIPDVVADADKKLIEEVQPIFYAAIELIRIWHSMGMKEPEAKRMWLIYYFCSPEMRKLMDSWMKFKRKHQSSGVSTC